MGWHVLPALKIPAMGIPQLWSAIVRAQKTVAFKWGNIILGDLKMALVGTFHKLSDKHLPRHLATFQYRFNRRCRLKDMIPPLAYMAARTPPMTARFLKLAENH